MDAPTAVEREVLGSLAGNLLHLILLPTESCNFRCTYCYEDHMLGRMEPSVVRGVRRLLTRRAPGLNVLMLSWFGGEPLLACDIIEEISLHAARLAEQTGGLRVESDITTNAYLLDRPKFERLLELGVSRYQIAFDGPRRIHDRKRVLAGGQGTFDRIWRNVISMRDVPGDFDITVRLHVDRENQDSLPEFVEQFREALGGDNRFNLFFRPLARLGGVNDAALPVLDEDESASLVDSLSREATECGLESRTIEQLSTACYASRANSFVVRADGRLNKCTVALEQASNQIGHIGPDGRVRIDAPSIRPWIRGLASEKVEELRCPLVGLPHAAK